MRVAALIGISWLISAVAPAPAAVSVPAPVKLAVVAPADDDHFARAAARRLRQIAAEEELELVVITASVSEDTGSLPDIFLMPVRSLATQVPELQVLELPFLFPSLDVVHRAVDGDLGAALARGARARGWEIMAWWDEGMHVLSGLKRYDRVRNLKIREFLVTRADPVAEKQFRYWRAHARRIDRQDRETVLRECLIASRAATLLQILHEQLYRVHLAVSLSNHRYEGWVVVAPEERSDGFTGETMRKLRAALGRATAWQRADARQRQADALAELRRAGMTVYEVDDAEREAFRQPLPDLAVLLPDRLDIQTRRALVALASAGAATVAGTAGGGAAAQPDHGPAPAADSGEDDQRED